MLQPTRNPYANKPTYGKDVCELMRRINKLESLTIPRQAVGWTATDADTGGEWWMCSNATGTVTYFVAHQFLEVQGKARSDIRVWALNTSGSLVSTVLWSSGTLTDPDGAYPRDEYPNAPLWCCCDGSSNLWIRANWRHDSGDPDSVTNLIKVSYKSIPPPAEVVVTWHNPSGAAVDGVACTYSEGEDAMTFGLLGRSEGIHGDMISYAKPVISGGFEVHSCGGLVDSLDVQHPWYKVETYDTGGALTDFHVYSLPSPTVLGHGCGATDDYFSFYAFGDSSDPTDGTTGIGHFLVRIDALPELDPSDDYKPSGSTVVGGDIPEAREDALVEASPGSNAYFGCVGGSGLNRFLTQPTAGWVPDTATAEAAAAPQNAVAIVSSSYNSTTKKWTHGVRYSQRLGHLGPRLHDIYGRQIAMDRTGDIAGMVSWGTDVWRVARWRLSAPVTETEWYAYPLGAARQSLGTPDRGVDVPTDNALVAAGAAPAGEHVIDMRTALLTLVDDHFVAVFREPRAKVGDGAYEGCFAAWDYWGAWAGEHTAWGTWPEDPSYDPDNVPETIKPVIYVALAHAHSKGLKYGLALETNESAYVASPTPPLRIASQYYRFRKSEDTDMDNTPMHDIDIGEVRALVDFLEASYENKMTFADYSRNWMPWGNGDNGCPF